MKIKITKLDKKFSHYIRWIRDKGFCQRCWKKYTPPSSGLHCSHFYGRARKSVRFDVNNVAAMCYGCHQFLTANPNDHRDLWKKRLGEHDFDLLTLRANTPNKPDYKLLEIWLDQQIKLDK